MNLLSQEQGQAAEAGNNLTGFEGPAAPEGLDEARAAEAAELAGPAAVGPTVDDLTHELFAHTDYELMDHMGG